MYMGDSESCDFCGRMVQGKAAGHDCVAIGGSVAEDLDPIELLRRLNQGPYTEEQLRAMKGPLVCALEDKIHGLMQGRPFSDQLEVEIHEAARDIARGFAGVSFHAGPGGDEKSMWGAADRLQTGIESVLQLFLMRGR
jgi:hypothetical protein